MLRSTSFVIASPCEGMQFQAQRIAFRIMGECLVRNVGVVHRLAEREFEMKPVLVAKARSPQRGPHRRNVRFVEADRLQVREAPPRLAQRGLQLDRLAIGGDAFGLPPDRLQHVAVAQPHARLVRALCRARPVKLDRLVELAEPAERRGLEVPVTDLVGLEREHVVEQFQRFRGPAHAAKDQRQIGPRRRPVRAQARPLAAAMPRHPACARCAPPARPACGSRGRRTDRP